MGDLTLIIQLLLNNATLVGLGTLLASLIATLGAIFQQVGIMRRVITGGFFHKQKEKNQEAHKIILTIDNQEFTVETASIEQIEAALKLAQRYARKRKDAPTETDPKAEEPSTVTSHTDDVNKEDI